MTTAFCIHEGKNGIRLDYISPILKKRFLKKTNYNNFCKARVSRQFGTLVSIDSFLNYQRIIGPKKKTARAFLFLNGFMK